MSGVFSAISGALGLAQTDPDLVAIEVGSNRFQGWQSLSITRSVETVPNSFSLTASSEFLQGAAIAGTRAGQPCKIFIGADLVITGWIDRRSIAIDGRSHQVTLSGRGITRNLVDCSADLVHDPGLRGGMISEGYTLDVAQKLANAYHITVVSNVADRGLPIRTFQVRLGETPYQIIESIARYARYLVYEDENGRLVLDRIGTQQMASGFTMPGNIEAIAAERSVDERFSDYVVTWYGIDQLRELNDTANQRARKTDPSAEQLGEYRLKISVSPQITPDYEFGEAYAAWEMARRNGRSQAAQITVSTWRDAAGKLWTPNWLATINAPAADIVGANWIIGTVTFRKDLSGTHADLVLMPQDAFSPEPSAINLFDRELVSQWPFSQDPAPLNPPSTSLLTGGHA